MLWIYDCRIFVELKLSHLELLKWFLCMFWSWFFSFTWFVGLMWFWWLKYIQWNSWLTHYVLFVGNQTKYNPILVEINNDEDGG